jgi:tight adherence protein C
VTLLRAAFTAGLVVWSSRVPRQRRLGLWTLAAVLWIPVPALIAGLVGLPAARWRRLASERREEAAAEADVVVLAQLAALALGAGLSLSEALDRAAAEVATPLRNEVDSVLRRSRREGIGPTLEAATGRARRLYLLAGRAAVTGAPTAAAVDAHVDELWAQRRMAQLEAARRLPVRLLFPLALLILPGFMVLTVGPAVMSALQRLGS